MSEFSGPGLGSQLIEFHPMGFIAALAGLVSWFLAGLDFYSRLNFATRKGDSWLQDRLNFSRVVISSLLVFVLIGAVYSGALDFQVDRTLTPFAFASSLMESFVASGGFATILLVLISIFCMIFTTIDTLLLTLLQAGWYSKIEYLKVENTLPVLATAVVISTGLPLDSISTVGVYAGSLLLVPFAAIVDKVILDPSRKTLFPGRTLLYSALLSVLGFGLSYSYVSLNFSRHYLLPWIVLVSLGVSFLVAQIRATVDSRAS